MQTYDESWFKMRFEEPVPDYKDVCSELLAISLEVAEHLVPDRALTFVKYLTERADIVLFSAAVPMQGGRGHVNEQPPYYWARLFRENGFTLLDILRSRFWEHNTLSMWCKQNFLVAVKEGVSLPQGVTGKEALWDIIHPEIFHYKQKQYQTQSDDAIRNAAKLEEELRKLQMHAVPPLPAPLSLEDISGRKLLLLLMEKVKKTAGAVFSHLTFLRRN